MADKIERAKNHLALCMEREDWPIHDCACNCGDVSELLAEVERLREQCVRATNLLRANQTVQGVSEGMVNDVLGVLYGRW